MSEEKQSPAKARKTMVQGAPEQTIPPEIRDELSSIMQQLLMKTHELSFEYSTLDCDKVQECPLAKKSKELFKVVKQLNETVKQLTPKPQGGYIS